MVRQRLRLEMLEGREVPAVAVDADFGLIGGPTDVDLRLIGDPQNDHIQITQSGTQITINALSGTTLTTGSINPAWIVSTPTSTQIVLDPQSAWDNLLVAAGAGNDTIEVFNTSFSKNVSISSSLGTDTVRIGAMQVGGNLVIQDPNPVNDGNDTVVMDGVRVQGDTNIRFRYGNDRCIITRSNFQGNLVIFGGPGNDLARFVPGLNQVMGHLNILTHGGQDRVWVDAAPSPGVPPTLEVNGNTAIYTHGGSDQVIFGNGTGTGLSVDLHGTLINTGNGNDSLAMRDAIMTLLVALLDNGNDAVLNPWSLTNLNITVGPGSLLDGGAGTDSLPSGVTPPSNLTVVNFP